MRTKIFSRCLLLCAVAASAFAPAAAQGDYRLVWQDEFDRDGAPNPEFWSYEEGFVRNNEWQWYQPQNAHVHDGLLVITAATKCAPTRPSTQRARRGDKSERT